MFHRRAILISWLLIAVSCLAVAPMAANKSQKPGRTEKKIVFWHWWTDQHLFLQELAERYRMETNVQVDFQLYSPTGRLYWSKIQAAAQADTLPDIIGLTDAPELLARYAKAGKLLEITNEMKTNDRAWEYSFFPRTINALYFPKYNIYGVKGDAFWGVPLSAMNIQMFYNRVLFKQAGLDPDRPPKTWKEFIKAGQKLRAKGIAPLISGFEDLWVAQTFFRSYAWAVLGEDKIRGLYVNELNYSDKECQEVLEYFKELKEKGFFYPGVAAMNNKEAEILFSRNKAAMIINGSWAVNVFAQMNPELDFGVMNFPKPDDAAYPMYVMGGLGKAAAITTNAKNPQAVIKFLRWLSARPQQERWARVNKGFPANLEAQDAIDNKLKPFVTAMNNLTPNLFLEERHEVLEILGRGMQSMLIGKATPYEVLWRVKNKKEELENKKSR